MATQIVIVHIGDIHIRDAHNPVLSRIDRELLSKRSDIIITGHEHLLDIFTEQSNSASPEYVAGRAMYDPRVADNGFNLITIDLTSKQRTVTSFLWRSRYYEPQAPETHAFLRNKAFAELGFQNNQAFLDRLSDIATGFTHARKALRLSDLFIYPNLAQRPQQRRLDGDQNLSPRRIRTRDIIGFILTTSRLFILGPQQSGRTSFAHMLYKLVQVEQKLIPLLIDGADLRSRDTVLSLLDTAFVDQYSKTALHSYKEAKAEQKCLIIDNLHRASISRTALAAVVRRLEGLFGKIVLFADERFDIDYVVSGSVQPVFYRYRQYLIEQLNRVQRATLIEKWLRLGRNDWDGNDTAYREVASKEATINTLLGRQLVPSYPIVIIALLQAMESASTPNMAHGSYGELYEALITTRFASVSRRSIELGIKYAITSRLAYWLFTNETDSFTVADANLVCDQYHLGIGLRLAASEVIAELIDAGVIKETAGNYRFSYPYYFHYFVARYLRDRRRDGESDPLVGAEVRKQVAFMADRVYFEEYSNILVFYLYLTKDICLIDHILTNAQQFFSDCAPCSLEADIEEINNLSLAQPLQAVLPCDDVNKNRYDLRERLDEIGSPLPRKRPRANAWSTATTWTI